jgi:hypothetical protein
MLRKIGLLLATSIGLVLSCAPREGTNQASLTIADAGTVDGAPQTVVPGEGGGSSWCSTQPKHTLCEDFDLGPVDTAKWDVVARSGGSMLRESAATSAPSALVLRVPETSEIAQAGITRFFDGAAKRVTFEADLMCEGFAFAASGINYLASVGGPIHGLNTTNVTLAYGSLGPSVRIQLPATDATRDMPDGATVPIKLALRTWTHMKVAIVYASTATGSVDVWIDGVSVYSLKDKITGQAPGVGVSLMLSPLATTPAATVRYDNATFDIEP